MPLSPAELAARVGEAMYAVDPAVRDFMQIELLACEPGRAVMRMTVRNQRGEVAAVLRGKSASLQGTVIPEET